MNDSKNERNARMNGMVSPTNGSAHALLQCGYFRQFCANLGLNSLAANVLLRAPILQSSIIKGTWWSKRTKYRRANQFRASLHFSENSGPSTHQLALVLKVSKMLHDLTSILAGPRVIPSGR